MSCTEPPSKKGDDNNDGLVYLAGFGNAFESEVLEGALPKGRNTPRLVPLNLYTEQLSGTAFTTPRNDNKRTWLYRIQPSVVVGGNSNTAEPLNQVFGQVHPKDCHATVNPLRWKPLPFTREDAERDFVSGMKLMCSAGGDNGGPTSKNGISIYMYACGKSMNSMPLQKHFYNADGDFLVVPQTGTLQVVSELGRMTVRPTEIFVMPRGIVFQVNLLFNNVKDEEADEAGTTNMARGYVLETFKGGFQLPELGPIGSNGLANARDFLHPTAWCAARTRSEYNQPCHVVVKMDSQLFQKTSSHCPYNVVAWHGKYLPYKYNLLKFCAVNSVTYDHLDPSIYTVLTCPSHDHGAGTALCDFVIFPPRYMATDPNTFRPPWFHRNTMSEYMGLIYGNYDAKQGGFMPGGASLHNTMTPHGPDKASYDKAVSDECKECVYFNSGLAFMFESCLPMKVSSLALGTIGGHNDGDDNDNEKKNDWLDIDYATCWQGLEDQFTGWDLLEKAGTS